MRRVRAAILVLTALMVLGAGLVPSCADLCCRTEASGAVRAEMPCCEPSMAQRDARVQPMTVASAPVSHAKQLAVEAIAAIDTVVAPAHLHAVTFAAAPAPPQTPPLFLLNAQFLI